MAQQSNSTIGSGTLPFTTQILPDEQRGQQANGRGERYGTNVVVINPEDQVAVDAFATSGVILTTSTVELVGPGSNPLPRSRGIIIENTDGSNDVLIGHRDNFQDPEGFILNATTEPSLSRIELPLLHNVAIYARAAAGTASVRFIVY